MKILFLPNWHIHFLKEDNESIQAPDKYVNGHPYWFFKYMPNVHIDIIDFQKGWAFHKIEKNFLKNYFYQSWKAFRNRKKYDLIISHGAQSGLFYSLLSTMFGGHKPKHIIIDIGGFNGGRTNKIETTLIKYALRSKPYIICHSKVIIENYKKTYKKLVHNTRFVHFGVNPEEFIPDINVPQKNCIFSFGYAKRDYETLIKAWNEIDHRGMKLRIAGVSFLSFAKDVNDVEFIGRISIEQLKNEIQSSMFVVIPLPVYNYSYGQMSFMQSMCLGKTVIVSKTPSSEDYLIDDTGSFFVEPYNVEDLKAKMLLLISNQALLRKSNDRARDYIVNNLTEEKMGMGILNFITEIMNS